MEPPEITAAAANAQAMLRARCLSCGYSLRGLGEHRCPECGRRFDPRNLWTVRLPERPHRLARWLASPPSRAARGIPVLGVIAIVWGASMPGWEDLVLWIGIILLFASGVGAMAWARTAAMIRRRGYPDDGAAQESRRWQRKVWRMIVAGIVLAALRPTLYARFWISKPWLARAAASIEAQPFSQSTPYPGQMRGLYQIGGTRRCPHGIKLHVTFPLTVSTRNYSRNYARDDGPGFFHRTDPGDCARFHLGWPLGGGWYSSR